MNTLTLLEVLDFLTRVVAIFCANMFFVVCCDVILKKSFKKVGRIIFCAECVLAIFVFVYIGLKNVPLKFFAL